MIKYFQNRFALSKKGAKDLWRGIVFSTLLNLSLMLPPIYLFFFLLEYLNEKYSLQRHTLWFYIVIAIVFMGIMLITTRWQYDSTYTTIYMESAQRRIMLAEKLRRLPLAFFSKRNLSDLTSTIMEDCAHLEQTFSHTIPQLFAATISIVVIGIGLFLYDWRLAIATFWVVPPAVVVLLFSTHRLGKAFTCHFLVKRSVTEQIQEGLECVQEIKSYNGENEYNLSFDSQLKDYEKELIKGELIASSFVSFSVVLLKLGMPSVILLGAWLMQCGELSLYIYLVFILTSAMIYNPIQEVCSDLAILSFLDVRINRIKEIAAMPILDGSKDIEEENYDIVFHNVCFSYETKKQVLHNISFAARQGEITALVGPSGGGKSTTAKLAARFWDIDSGQITIGGKDISKIDPEVLLKNYAVVFQDVLLFNTSVANNIRIGKRDATDEEVHHVAQLAQCDDFISQMPQGYDTIIGENGETLSGGERQRISIARALLKDAPIILLDEATANLDAENETKIQAGISELVRNKTVIIIAHRMRTVRNADHIVVFDGGKISEQGSPEELLNKNGEFARIVKLQMEKETV